ncbi:MAG: C69 family dipeptidase [Lentimicrobiaceae bacterium]
MRTTINLILIVLLTTIWGNSKACTNFLVSKGASVDGSTMISYAADSHVRYGELYWKPAADWPEGTMVTLYDRGSNKPLGQIPQARHTYQVTGFMNEFQVAIGETTFGGRPGLEDSTGIVDYGSLMFVALQRSKTAREAIKVMAELVEQFGYASSGESLSIGDPNEVWIMEIVGKGTKMVTDKKTKKSVNVNKGAVWVAMRVPEGYISAHANQSRIATFPLENKKNSISSKNMNLLNNPGIEVVYAHDVIDFARTKAFFTGKDEDFSFCQTYNPLNFESLRFCELRVWMAFNAINSDMLRYYDYAKGDITKERIPLFIKPDSKLTPRDLMSFYRDYFQGTELDMSKDAGAGPFGSPYRWRPLTWKYDGVEYFNERATVTQQTGFSFIAQMRNWLPDHIGGINWFGVDDAGSTVYVPFYCGITKVPYSYAEGNGDMLTYSDDAAFWVFNRVAQFKYLFYNRVMPDLKIAQDELESGFADEVKKVDNEALALYKVNPEKARMYLTNYSEGAANKTIKRWKELDHYLLVKYMDGNVKKVKDGKFLRNAYGFPQSPLFPGYSETWKEQVIQKTGDKLLYKE